MDRIENIEHAFEMMGQGMGGIFVTIAIIVVCVWIMGRLGRKKNKEKMGKERRTWFLPPFFHI